MKEFGWTVLGLVFLDELLAMAAFAVWGWDSSPRWLLVFSVVVNGLAMIPAIRDLAAEPSRTAGEH